ncbi:MAG TPA: anthranilate synthase component I [Propionibacteriaceae bacterium]|nr:anthranilate synthase component I [Micropruina sp.]HBX81265.1 anthranilate synthase component I [Propionibacteriaceae bacterium]HBY22782.1 anthranilate synthase component I [Propionibacteriaceae bacterium]
MSVRITPDLTAFEAMAPHHRVIGVHTRLRADNLTAVGLYHQLCGTRPGTFLLESAEDGVFSRYSFVGVNAAATLSEVGGEATWSWSGRAIAGLPSGGNPLDVLAETLRILHTEPAPGLPPFTSGLVGYLGYDVVRRLEKLPDTNPDDLGIPELTLLLAADVAVLDHHNGEVWLIANAINFDDSGAGVQAAHADAVARVEAMVAALLQPTAPLIAEEVSDEEPVVRRQRSPEEFQQMVRDCVEEIRAGEAFQIVASQRFEADCDTDPLDVYRVLRRTNPSPYLYLLRLDGLAIVGSSPEALVRVQDGRAVTYPIAGTKPRGATPEQDIAYEAALLSDPKEAAEHLMLVDLGRNDLGRVCEPGSVEVLEFMKVRRYSHVMHLEAAVTGRVAAGRTALDVTLSAFPAGTLSGAPKVRAMEIIDRLEASRRGLYGGVVGYFDFAGNSDCAIAIRTGLLKDGVAYVQAGAGIVADSVPESEDAETRNKAGAVLRAVGEAGRLRRLATSPQP